MYSSNGKPNVVVDYSNGMPLHIDCFWDADCCNPFKPDYKILPYTLIGGSISPFDLGTFDEDFISSIKNYKSKGYDIGMPKGYFKYCSVDYRIDSVPSNSVPGVQYKTSIVCKPITYYSSENIKYKLQFLDSTGIESNYVIYDKTGIQISSTFKEAEEEKKQTEEENKKLEQELSKIIQCYYCKKAIVKRNSIPNLLIRCLDADVGGIHFPFHFCSIKCSEEYQCIRCKQNGYDCNR
jgi:hypothetical protein